MDIFVRSATIVWRPSSRSTTGPLAKSSPLIGRVLLQASGAAATGEDEDDGAAQAPLLLRAVGARKQRGGDVLVRCVALFGEGDETYEISEATARRAAVRRETAEAQAMVAMHARGGKYTFHTTKIASASVWKSKFYSVCSHCVVIGSRRRLLGVASPRRSIERRRHRWRGGRNAHA